MRNVLIAAARIFKQWIGWQRLGLLISLVIIGVAVVTLYRLLQDVDVGEVFAALKAKPWHSIAIAGLLIAAAYFTLSFYDYFSLRTIGKGHVPYRVALLTAFTAYSIGHNIGAMVLTGGAVRFRIYSQWGLTVVDVAKIAFVTGLTFWLGNAFVLGLGVLFDPQAASAVDQLPPEINRVLAVAGLLSIVAYLGWLTLRPRVVGMNDWQVTLPNASLTMVQIVIGMLDLGLSALAMYALMPGLPPIDFLTLLVIFVMATLLGFVSHTPGAIGVFDAAMLVGLAQFDKEDLLAALLIYRFLYYIVPFILALAILAGRELWLNLTMPAKRRRPQPPDASISEPARAKRRSKA